MRDDHVLPLFGRIRDELAPLLEVGLVVVADLDRLDHVLDPRQEFLRFLFLVAALFGGLDLP